MTICNKHRNQMYRHGKTLERTERDKNEIRVIKDYAEVIMNTRKGEEITAIIDIEDIEKVSKYRWGYGNGYAHAKVDGELTTMHKLLLDAEVVDHEDRDKLNNRRGNLREADKSKNSMNIGIRNNNASGFTGVGFMKKLNKWRAYIKIDGKDKHLGSFENIDDAVRARLKAEKELFGEFAPQQDLFEEYGV